MRIIFSAICASLLIISPAQADIITINYTGTYSGSWFGNYSPFEAPKVSNVNQGVFDIDLPFSLKFTFDTDRAQPGTYDDSHIGLIGGSSLPLFPSAGSAYFQSSARFLGAGSAYAYDSVSNGFTSQFASDLTFGRAGIIAEPVISMTASIPLIFDSIFDSFALSSNQPIGNGQVTYGYESTQYGGGRVTLTLKAFSIDVDVTNLSAVPEASTWAMMLIGFAGVGYMSYRRKRVANIGV